MTSLLTSLHATQRFSTKRGSVLPLATLAAVCLWVSGCSAGRYFLEYRINVQQGNLIEQKQTVQLRQGMTRDQVRYVMGTPLLQDPFHANRWDYVYRYEDGKTGKVSQRNVTVYFNDAGLLDRVTGDVEAAQPVAGTTAVDSAALPSNEPQTVDLGGLDENGKPPKPVKKEGGSWWWPF